MIILRGDWSGNMRINYFFELIEKTNEFKTLVGETIKVKVTVSYDGNVLGTAQNLEQFLKVIGKEMIDKIEIGEVQKTSSLREFKIVFVDDGEKKNIKLFVE
jgi:hypothetical protein